MAAHCPDRTGSRRVLERAGPAHHHRRSHYQYRPSLYIGGAIDVSP